MVRRSGDGASRLLFSKSRLLPAVKDIAGSDDGYAKKVAGCQDGDDFSVLDCFLTSSSKYVLSKPRALPVQQRLIQSR